MFAAVITVICDTQVQNEESELTSAKPPLPTAVSGEGNMQSDRVLLIREVHACASKH